MCNRINITYNCDKINKLYFHLKYFILFFSLFLSYFLIIRNGKGANIWGKKKVAIVVRATMVFQVKERAIVIEGEGNSGVWTLKNLDLAIQLNEKIHDGVSIHYQFY